MRQKIYSLILLTISILSIIAGRFEPVTIHRTETAATVYWVVQGKRTVAASFIEFEIVNFQLNEA